MAVRETHPCAGGCGRQVTGTRCRACNVQFLKEQAALTSLEDDRALLAMRDVERLTQERIAARRGVERQRVGQQLRNARRREAVRKELGV